MYYPDELVEEVRDKNDIVDVVGSYVHLTKKGNTYFGLCPFHNEKTPSFSVTPGKQMYYCFGCGAGGNVYSFIMNYENATFPEAVKILADRVNVALPEIEMSEEMKKQAGEKARLLEVNKEAAKYFYYLLRSERGKRGYEYLKNRGLSDDTLKNWGMGYSDIFSDDLVKYLRSKNYRDEDIIKAGLASHDEKRGLHDKFWNRVMFPIWDINHRVIGFGGRVMGDGEPKYLNSPETIIFDKSRNLFGLNFARSSKKGRIILCEGYMDAIAYHQCGIDYAVAPLGTAFTEGQLKMLAPFVNTVLLSFDSDGAGQAATYKAIILCRSLDLSVKIIQLKGGKDPAEIMINFGADALTKVVEGAILDNDFLLSKLLEKYPKKTPEDKVKAALEFFPYVDSLSSDIQKDSTLEQFAQAFNTKLEAVKRDFVNREQARSRLEQKKTVNGAPVIQEIKLNAELRTILAVISNLEQFNLLHEQLTVNDFEDPLARQLFIILEECFRDQEFSISGILNHCAEEEVQRMITRVIASREFEENNLQYVQESIRLIKRNSLERQRDRLMLKIRDFKIVTPDDQNTLTKFLSEKMEIDKKLQE